VLTFPYAMPITSMYGAMINDVLDDKLSPRDSLTKYARDMQAEVDKWRAARGK
jgi:hypothetical protein